MDSQSVDLEKGYQASLEDLEKGFQATAAPSPLAAPAPQKGMLETAKDFITAPLGKGPLAGYTEKVPAAPLELAMPGGMMAQTIGQGVLGAGKEAAAGGGPLSIGRKGVEGAAGGLAGGLIGKGIGKAATALGGLGRYSDDIGNQIAAKLKETVPAYSTFEPTVKGLKEMLYGSGEKALHAAYDKSLTDLMTKGKGQIVQVPEDIATRMGLSNQGAGVAGLPANVQALFNRGAQKAGMQAPGTPGSLGVDAAELAQKMTGLWQKDPQAYRAAANALDTAGIGDPAARTAYKTAMGVKDFLGKLPAEGFDVLKAQGDLLGPRSKALSGRGLDEIRNILAPQGVGQMPSKGTMAGPLGVLGGIAGLGIGGAAGGHMGHAGALGPLGGVGGGAWLGQKVGSHIPVTKGLPPTRIQELLKMLGARAGGIAGPEVGP